jgi:hypothetical protein
MFWARPELDLLAAHYRSINDKKATFEMDAALSFIDSEYSEMLSILPTLLPHSITFEYLWAILPSDCLLVGKNRLNFDSIWCVRSHVVEKTQEGIFLNMTAEYLVWDGTKVGRVDQALRIPIFTGVKLISDLPYIPLKYHPRREDVIREVKERSSKALEFWKPEFRHQEHHGTGIAEVYDKVEPYPVGHSSKRTTGNNTNVYLIYNTVQRTRSDRSEDDATDATCKQSHAQSDEHKRSSNNLADTYR